MYTYYLSPARIRMRSLPIRARQRYPRTTSCSLLSSPLLSSLLFSYLLSYIFLPIPFSFFSSPPLLSSSNLMPKTGFFSYYPYGRMNWIGYIACVPKRKQNRPSRPILCPFLSRTDQLVSCSWENANNYKRTTFFPMLSGRLLIGVEERSYLVNRGER
ncbi:hypothetical protein M434DRAFT_231052 [Hypoxylon sp. CO27-5]|nr:hypothetical protein M434DRAFT_231052 [Hypoxylon sp. CO27-5]